MEPLPQPWEQQPDESPAAFQAFVAFRDMGPGRTIMDAYRTAKGRPEARDVPGTWKGWASRLRWSNRARAYDRHIEAERLKAVEQAERAKMVQWIERRNRSLEDRYQAAEAGLVRAWDLLRFPVHQVRTEGGGKITIVEPVNADLLWKAVASAREAGEMSAAVIREALDLAERQQNADQAADPEAQKAILDQAAAELADWSEDIQNKIRLFLESPGPPGPPPAPQPA